jgi:hypothetical protein
VGWDLHLPPLLPLHVFPYLILLSLPFRLPLKEERRKAENLHNEG